MFSYPRKFLTLGVSSAIINFNEGLCGLKSIFNSMNLIFGFYGQEGASKKDMERKRHSKRKSSETFMTSRKKLKELEKVLLTMRNKLREGNHTVQEVFKDSFIQNYFKCRF